MKYTIDYKKFFEKLRFEYNGLKAGNLTEAEFIEMYRKEMVSVAQSAEGTYVIKNEVAE